MTEQRCGDCEYWKRTAAFAGTTLGECRRRAPVVVTTGGHNPPTKFPLLLSSDIGCGEFSRRRVAARHARCIAAASIQRKHPLPMHARR